MSDVLLDQKITVVLGCTDGMTTSDRTPGRRVFQNVGRRLKGRPSPVLVRGRVTPKDVCGKGDNLFEGVWCERTSRISVSGVEV